MGDNEIYFPEMTGAMAFLCENGEYQAALFVGRIENGKLAGFSLMLHRYDSDPERLLQVTTKWALRQYSNVLNYGLIFEKDPVPRKVKIDECGIRTPHHSASADEILEYLSRKRLIPVHSSVRVH